MGKILFYTFLAIFILTAILTLLSLPDWIKIQKSYKKVLFSSLLIEVVGCVIFLFKQEMNFNYTIQPHNNWVAISTIDGEIIQPKIINPDSIMFLGLDRESTKNLLKLNSLSISKNENKYRIANKTDDFTFGTIEANDLKELGFYNNLQAWQNEIPNSDNYKIIKFIYNEEDNKWIQKGSLPISCPLKIEVYSTTEVGYKITDIQNSQVKFDSSQESQDVINLDNRKLHFFEINGVFYLTRITQADLFSRSSEKYIHFMMVKLQPQLI